MSPVLEPYRPTGHAAGGAPGAQKRPVVHAVAQLPELPAPAAPDPAAHMNPAVQLQGAGAALPPPQEYPAGHCTAFPAATAPESQKEPAGAVHAAQELRAT